MAPLLTAALIARDESRFLGDCLASLTGIVDEVIVVDTGSVDDTPDIARSFGAVVVHHPWRDDFAEARNQSLERAQGRWILYIDADERVVDGDRRRLEHLLESADEVAFRVLLRPRVGATPYREFRLWRNDPRIRFEGVIHEKVVPAIERVAASDGRRIGESDLMLQHLGYEGDQTHKHLRNLPLLRRQLAVEPGNLFAWNHLGRVLEALDEPTEAEAAFERAIETARAQAASAGTPVDRLACLSYGDLVRLRAQRGADTGAVLAEALATFPDNCLLLLLEAQRLMEGQHYDAALVPLERILAFDWADADDPPAYDAPIVGELPWSAKGLCLFRLGSYDEAAEAYLRAAQCAPDDSAYRVKADLARARAARGRGASS